MARQELWNVRIDGSDLAQLAENQNQSWASSMIFKIEGKVYNTVDTYKTQEEMKDINLVNLFQKDSENNIGMPTMSTVTTTIKMV